MVFTKWGLTLTLLAYPITGLSPELRLFRDYSWSGPQKTLKEATPNFGSIGFNDHVSSVKAVAGNWELYQDYDYEGERMTIAQGTKTDVNVNDFYSSGRPICNYISNPAVAKLVVYEDYSQGGNKREILRDVSWLGDYWNDRISSVYSVVGDWELYTHGGFTGQRVVVRQGQKVDVPINDAFSSIRPLCKTYAEKMQCRVSRIDILEMSQSTTKYEGIKVIGSGVKASCKGPFTEQMILSNVNTVENINLGLEVSEVENDIYWQAASNVEVVYQGLKTKTNVRVAAGDSGLYDLTATQSLDFSPEIAEQGTSYDAPGGSVVFGAVDRYTTTWSNAPANVHIVCPELVQVKRTNLKMWKTRHDNPQLLAYVGRFTTAACDADRNIIQCVLGVRKIYSHFVGNKDVIRDAFRACFSDGKGTVVN